MRLRKILEKLNSFEKNAFLKIMDGIIYTKSPPPRNSKEIDKILTDDDKDLKSVDNLNVAKVFNLVEEEFREYLNKEFVNTTSPLDIFIDIFIRDGNCIMSRDWFKNLYDNELKNLKAKSKEFNRGIKSDTSEIDEDRLRDYKIYQECTYTAYFNDQQNNLENKITSDEQSILVTLAQKLELSQEEIKLLNYSILPIQEYQPDQVIDYLRNCGVIFYHKKDSKIFIANEIVRILRKIRGKEVADKFFRRILKLLKEPQINMICKKHNIDRKLNVSQKIKQILKEGISFTSILENDIYRPGIKLSEKKIFLNQLFDKGFKISKDLRGNTIQDKIQNIIQHFDSIEKDEKVGITMEGYEKMLSDLSDTIIKFSNLIKTEFELQGEETLDHNFLLDYNIKPRDILEIIHPRDLEKLCKTQSIKTRGNLVINILEKYNDAENLYLENYENIGFRNLSELKEAKIKIKEAELGAKFEKLTKKIFVGLGFNVDEDLRRKLNTQKDKIDIVLNLGESEIIIIECKTIKEKALNKFSIVSRQIKSYINLAISRNFKVKKALLIAPEFTDNFVNDCQLDAELNLSLIEAQSLLNIFKGFKGAKNKYQVFPHNLFMRDVVINEEMTLKAINK